MSLHQICADPNISLQTILKIQWDFTRAKIDGKTAGQILVQNVVQNQRTLLPDAIRFIPGYDRVELFFTDALELAPHTSDGLLSLCEDPRTTLETIKSCKEYKILLKDSHKRALASRRGVTIDLLELVELYSNEFVYTLLLNTSLDTKILRWALQKFPLKSNDVYGLGSVYEANHSIENLHAISEYYKVPNRFWHPHVFDKLANMYILPESTLTNQYYTGQMRTNKTNFCYAPAAVKDAARLLLRVLKIDKNIIIKICILLWPQACNYYKKWALL